MVRVRDPQHLDNLQSQFPQLRGCTRTSSIGTDYPARMFVSKRMWADVVRALVLDLDYGNFKSRVSAARLTAPSYGAALHSVWSVMHRVEPREDRR
ncbi:MAG TPA: hypothetical protein VGC54_02435 [Planctomycetota bacterium]